MDKKSSNKKSKKILYTIIILVVGGYSYYSVNNDLNSDSTDNTTTTGVYGTYGDFSDWSNYITGEITVRSTGFSGYIQDNNTRTNYSGDLKGNDLYDSGERIGYLSNGELYIYYLNGYYPIGK